MKYTSYKSDIIGILHSSDNNFVLKFYDNDGNVTLDENDALWIYIESLNIIIKMPDDENSIITVWSSKTTIPDDFEKIIQRMRHLSVVNGVSLSVKLYNNLDRRKIYNIIKKAIINRKESDMNESYNGIDKIICEVSNTLRNTKKPSDFYISESMHSKNISSLTESYINILSGINDLNNNKIKKLFKMVSLETSNKGIKKIVECFKEKCPDDYNKLCENKENIKNISKFIKSRFLNNIETKPLHNVQFVLENVVAYAIKTKMDNDNLVKAYNHLITVSEGVNRGIDLLRVIKKHKLCETYKVSKESLLDFWLSRDVKKVEEKKLIVFETSNGDVISVSEDMRPSILLLGECINNGGRSDDVLFNNIIDETIKFNHLTNLLENHSYNFQLKNYITDIKNLYLNSYNKLKNNKLVSKNFEQILMLPYDYSKQLALIESKLGFKHPGLKYLAMEEAKKNIEKSVILEKNTIKDRNILESELNKLTSFSKSKMISESIVKNGINIINKLNNTENKFNVCKKLLNNTYSADVDSNNTLQECLYVFVTNPSKFNYKRKQFVETLLKYIS